MDWLRRNGVAAIDNLFAGNGAMVRKGTRAWLAGMPVKAVVLGEEWRYTDDVARLSAVGTHVHFFYNNSMNNCEYSMGNKVFGFWEENGRQGIRFEDTRRKRRLFFDETPEGMELVAFLGKGIGGNAVVNPMSPSRMSAWSWRD